MKLSEIIKYVNGKKYHRICISFIKGIQKIYIDGKQIYL